jgi:hypothetical protein
MIYESSFFFSFAISLVNFGASEPISPLRAGYLSQPPILPGGPALQRLSPQQLGQRCPTQFSSKVVKINGY